jgi:KaiC/GvpD/RAD55 family RecA-like ATPase
MTDLDWEKLWQEPPTAPPQPPHHANGRRPPAPGIGVASVSNADRWVDAAVAGIEAELRDSGTWPQGYSDSYGRGWDKLQADAAMRLGAIAKADWNRFSFDEAHARFIAAAPTGGGWSGRDVEYKWRYHSARATPAPAPSGVTDPRPAVGIVDPLELLAPPPANGIWEAAVAATDAPPSDEQAERPRTSWWPSPIAERAAEAEEAPTPTHLLRDDGEALFYSGKVNGLIGESESGKSWVALLAVQQATADGERCLVLDFEDSPASVKRRLDALQLDPAQLGLVDYADPQEALGALQSADLQEAIGQHYRIIVADGVNAAMTLMGYDLNSNTDATEFSTRLLRPMARTGACVITVDHVPKNPETRGKGGIGAQQKRALQDGTCLLVEVRRAVRQRPDRRAAAHRRQRPQRACPRHRSRRQTRRQSPARIRRRNRSADHHRTRPEAARRPPRMAADGRHGEGVTAARAGVTTDVADRDSGSRGRPPTGRLAGRRGACRRRLHHPGTAPRTGWRRGLQQRQTLPRNGCGN